MKPLHVFVAWAALIALMLASLGSAYVPLGPWNSVISLAIAAVKIALVLWWFMQLRRAGALLRLCAAVGLFMLALLFGLSGLDDATRDRRAAPVQAPQQLPQLRPEPGSTR
jgi:cytochrome c oxidase subunit 4